MNFIDQSNSAKSVRVSIEVKRIQTFLFAIPRLKSMVGANSILGETLRGCWLDRDNNYSEGSLARLAVECEAVPAPGLPPQLGNAFPEDPLRDEDDPARDWCNGILARDGGRFIAAFDGNGTASEFARRAHALLQEKLPGALFQIHLDQDGQRSETFPPPEEATVPFLPQFQVCMESGIDPASHQEQVDGVTRYQSTTYQEREACAIRLADGKSHDPVGLFYRGLPEYQRSIPGDFEQMCGTSYLAVLHADGNKMGDRQKRFGGSAGGGNGERKTAEFFHAMRRFVRVALAKSIQDIFSLAAGPASFRILMLGGDDLLMVMRAEHALPFAEAYAKNLSAMGNMPDGFPLDVGCGVVIARRSFPFFRLHDIAEELTASAKRLARGGTSGSVIDWHVSTDSHIQSVRDSRSHWVIDYQAGDRAERLVLSRRPMPILAPEAPETPSVAEAEIKNSVVPVSLEGLLKEAKTVKQVKIPRSPLRALADELSCRRYPARLSFQEFYTKLTLEQRGAIPWLKDPWESADHVSLTRFLDLLEILEISNLKTQAKPGGNQ